MRRLKAKPCGRSQEIYGEGRKLPETMRSFNHRVLAIGRLGIEESK